MTEVPTPARSRSIALVVALLAAWIAGSTFGAALPSRSSANASPLFQIEPVRAGYVPALDGTEPIFVLLLGSDARPGEEIDGQRADSIHIVAINPVAHKATIVGFPRDSYVPIPGFGTNKINAAMTLGGPEKVVETVEALTGLEMDYWALTWFEGFQKMVNGVGGLTVDIPFAMSDPSSRAYFEAGVQHLDGRSALAFARNRKDLPSGDFGRSENQGRLMIAALAQFIKEFKQDPSRLITWVASAYKNASTSVPLDQLLHLAFTGTTIEAKRVVNVVLPGSTSMAGGLSVVDLDQTALQTISEDLAEDGLLRRVNIPLSPNHELLPEPEAPADEG